MTDERVRAGRARGPRTPRDPDAPRYSWTAPVLRTLTLVVSLWVVLGALFLIVIALSAREGLAKVEHATTTIAPEDLVVGKNFGPLERARNDFGAAHLLGETPVLRSFELVPGFGRQLRGVRDLTGAAHETLALGVHAIERSQFAVHEMKKGGPARVSGMRLIADVAAESRTRVQHINLGSSHGLARPLAHAQARFRTRIPKLTKALGDLHEVATGLASFLDGPRSYLLFAANNNEMRLGSGSFLSGALLLTDHGTIRVWGMEPTAPWKLSRHRAAKVPLAPDQQQVWGWLSPNSEWRNLAASPRFDTTADLSRRMFEQRFGYHLDGVLAIDPVALDGIVNATGPVDVGGRALQGDALLRYVFLQQYTGVSVFDTKQHARRDALGGIAQDVVHRIETGQWDTAALVHAMRTVGRGRHILAWSARPDEERA